MALLMISDLLRERSSALLSICSESSSDAAKDILLDSIFILSYGYIIPLSLLMLVSPYYVLV
jgi:hypothetical protein